MADADEPELELLREIEGLRRRVAELEMSLVRGGGQEALQQQGLLQASALARREREFDCLECFADVVQGPDASVEAVLRAMLHVIPVGARFPKTAVVRVTFRGEIYESPQFDQSVVRQSSDIFVHGERVGALALGYLQEPLPVAGDHSLQEEKRLLGILAERLGHVIERLEASQQLRAAHARSRGLIEASADPMVALTLEGRITDVNSAGLAVSGLSREELLGTSLADHFTDPEAVRAGLELVLEETVIGNVRLELLHRDGHAIPVLCNAAIYRDEAGEVVGMVAVAHDITARETAQAALEAANAYNRRLIEASVDPLVAIAPDGRITDVNTATEAVTGLAREELIGTDFCDYFTDPERARAGYQQVFRDGSVRDYRLEVVHRDGRVTPVLYNASVYRDDAGEVVGVFAAARDISLRERVEAQRREAEEALEATLRLTDAAFTQSVTGQVLLDPDFTFLRVNEAFARTCGRSISDFVGRKVFDMYPSSARAIFEDAVASREPRSVRERPFIFPDHPEWGTKYLDWTIQPILDDGGQVRYLYFTVSDVTDRVRAEEQRRRAEAAYDEQLALADAVFSQSVTCQVLLDRDFNFIRVNEAYARACGLEVSDFEGRNHFEMYPSDALPVFEEVLRTKKPYVVMEKPFSFPDHPEWGTTYWDWMLQPILDDKGEVRYLLFSLVDVTARVRAEEGRRKAQAAYDEQLRLAEAAFSQSITCQALLDPDFNFVRVNEAYARSGARDVSEFPGRNHFEMYPSDTRPIFETVVRTKRPQTVIAKPFTYPDHPEWGVSYWDWTLTPILDDEGEVRYLLFSLHDVTERQRSVEALLRYQEDLRSLASDLAVAEEKARRAVAVDIHDTLGQLLAFMKMRMGALRASGGEAELDAHVAEVQDLLDQAIRVSRSLTFELSPPVLYELGLGAALEWLADEFRQRHGLEVDLEDDGQEKPMSDEVRAMLFRAVRELLTNAVKHAEASHVSVGLTKVDDTVRVEVQDNGRGFDPSALEERDRESGGFGLFSLRVRLRHMGGSMTVDSEPGMGTRVVLSAPLSEERAAHRR